jgi:HSP20 family molecular chaperone IbpA
MLAFDGGSKAAVHLPFRTAVRHSRCFCTCGRCGMFANTLKRDVFADDFPLVPGLEVSERPGGLTLQVALGDVNPEDVSVAAEEGVLRIKGERKLEGVKRIYRFTRSMPLPSGVRATEITRDFHDGVLTVTVPFSTALVRNA